MRTVRVVATAAARRVPAATRPRRGLPWSVPHRSFRHRSFRHRSFRHRSFRSFRHRSFPPAVTGFTFALLLIAVLGGCDGGGGGRPAPSPPSSAPATAAAPVVLSVTTVRGRPLLDIVARNGTTTVTSLLRGAKVTITGKGGRYTAGGRLVAVVRTSADGVRLANPAGRTLWRARAAAGLLQIRRGEARTRYSIRREGPGRITVRRGSVEVGDVRAIEQGARIELGGGAALALSSSPPADDLAVLLCREVPPDLRAVLVAAMLTRP